MKKFMIITSCLIALTAFVSCSKKEETATEQPTETESVDQSTDANELPAQEAVVDETPTDKLKRTAAELGTVAVGKTYTGVDGRTWTVTKTGDSTYEKADSKKLVQKFSPKDTMTKSNASCPKFIWKGVIYNGSVETYLGYSILNDGATFAEQDAQTAYTNAKSALDEYLATK